MKAAFTDWLGFIGWAILFVGSLMVILLGLAGFVQYVVNNPGTGATIVSGLVIAIVGGTLLWWINRWFTK